MTEGALSREAGKWFCVAASVLARLMCKDVQYTYACGVAYNHVSNFSVISVRARAPQLAAPLSVAMVFQSHHAPALSKELRSLAVSQMSLVRVNNLPWNTDLLAWSHGLHAWSGPVHVLRRRGVN